MDIFMVTQQINLNVCIDRELRKEYENEFGLDTKDTGYSYYTHEEQIERYAKNMLFWIKHTPTWI